MKRSCFFHRWVLGEFFFYVPTSLAWLFRTAVVSATFILNLQGSALLMLLLPQYTPSSGASWALLQATRFFSSFPPYFPFFLSSSVISRERYCLGLLTHPPCCAASTLCALREAAKDRANSAAPLMSWTCPALPFKVCLHHPYVCANICWAEALLTVCNSLLQLHLAAICLQKLHCGNWPQAA